VLQCVVAAERYADVRMFEQVYYLTYFRGVVCEDGSFCFVFRLLFQQLFGHFLLVAGFEVCYDFGEDVFVIDNSFYGVPFRVTPGWCQG
jgi:hypothetical protein